jgi:hypothetical protein
VDPTALPHLTSALVASDIRNEFAAGAEAEELLWIPRNRPEEAA